jgi:hypothetical protein
MEEIFEVARDTFGNRFTKEIVCDWVLEGESKKEYNLK